jgi:hypothetical protein
MGLDWGPLDKPKVGFEERYDHLFRVIQGKEKVQLSFLDRLRGKRLPKRDELLQEWFSIQIGNGWYFMARMVMGLRRIFEQYRLQG